MTIDEVMTTSEAMDRIANQPCPHHPDGFGRFDPLTGELIDTRPALAQFCPQCLAPVEEAISAEKALARRADQHEERLARLEAEVERLRSEGGPGAGNRE